MKHWFRCRHFKLWADHLAWALVLHTDTEEQSCVYSQAYRHSAPHTYFKDLVKKKQLEHVLLIAEKNEKNEKNKKSTIKKVTVFTHGPVKSCHCGLAAVISSLWQDSWWSAPLLHPDPFTLAICGSLVPAGLIHPATSSLSLSGIHSSVEASSACWRWMEGRKKKNSLLSKSS